MYNTAFLVKMLNYLFLLIDGRKCNFYFLNSFYTKVVLCICTRQ